MDQPIITMAGYGTDAAWFFDNLIRHARARNIINRNKPVFTFRSIDEAVVAIGEKKPGIILSAVQPKKTLGCEQFSPDVTRYLQFLHTYRKSATSYVPLVLVGNYQTSQYDAKNGSSQYNSLEHAARISRPDICVVERIYNGPNFNMIFGKVVSLFSDVETFKDNPILVTTVSRIVSDNQKPELSRVLYGDGLVRTRPHVSIIALPDSFRQDATTQTPH